MRKKLNMRAPEEITNKIDAGESHISTLKQAIKNAQASVLLYNKRKLC